MEKETDLVLIDEETKKEQRRDRKTERWRRRRQTDGQIRYGRVRAR